MKKSKLVTVRIFADERYINYTIAQYRAYYYILTNNWYADDEVFTTIDKAEAYMRSHY